MFGLTEARFAEIKEMFLCYDQDGLDGFVTAEEISDAIKKSTGEYPTDSEFQAMIQAMDQNGDGRFGFTQFMTIMQNRMNSYNSAAAIKYSDVGIKEEFLNVDVDRDTFIIATELKRLFN